MRAEHMHAQLKRSFARYHEWSSEVVREARAGHWLHSTYGWRQFMDPFDVLTIKNWKMQSGGAEMTRLACCLATERGVLVCGPIHDAIMVEASLDGIDEAVATVKKTVGDKGRAVLEGHTVPVDAEVVRWPDRYRPDEEHREMWERVLRLAGVTEEAPETCLSSEELGRG